MKIAHLRAPVAVRPLSTTRLTSRSCHRLQAHRGHWLRFEWVTQHRRHAEKGDRTGCDEATSISGPPSTPAEAEALVAAEAAVAAAGPLAAAAAAADAAVVSASPQCLHPAELQAIPMVALEGW